MRTAFRVVAAGLCLAIAVGLIAWLTGQEWRGGPPRSDRGPADSKATAPAASIGLETFPDPNAPGTSSQVFIDETFFDTEIFDTAFAFTGPIRDPRSLDELRESVRGRGRRGLASFRAQYDAIRLDASAMSDQVAA